MSDLPDPLTPPGCDLRDFAWMPMDVVRLRDSELAGLRDGEAFRAAVLLFCAAWHQVPAGSLPNEIDALARLAGYGRDMKTFQKARASGALRGWILCSDGRLYHPVVAEKAREASDNKAAAKARTEAARKAKQERKESLNGGGSAPPQASATKNVTSFPTERVTSSVAQSVTEPVASSNRTEQTVPDQRSKIPPLGAPPRGTRLPADWAPSDADLAFADRLGVDGFAVGLVFRDYWHALPGAKATKLDWAATWRNWCRKDAGRPLSLSPARARKAASDAKMRAFLAGPDDQPIQQPRFLT